MLLSHFSHWKIILMRLHWQINPELDSSYARGPLRYDCICGAQLSCQESGDEDSRGRQHVRQWHQTEHFPSYMWFVWCFLDSWSLLSLFLCGSCFHIMEPSHTARWMNGREWIHSWFTLINLKLRLYTPTHLHPPLTPTNLRVFMLWNQPNFGGDLLLLRLSYVSFS